MGVELSSVLNPDSTNFCVSANSNTMYEVLTAQGMHCDS